MSRHTSLRERASQVPVLKPLARRWRALRRSSTAALGHPSIGSFRASEPPNPPPTDAFTSLFLRHEGRLVHKWLHCGRAYDRMLGEYRTGFPNSGTRRPVRFLEIGVSHGGSLELWREYLGEDAVIFGIDIDPRCAEVGRDDLHVRIGSQADEAFLRSVVKEMGGVDIVLDDGSHIASHQRTSFDVLFPLLTARGHVRGGRSPHLVLARMGRRVQKTGHVRRGCKKHGRRDAWLVSPNSAGPAIETRQNRHRIDQFSSIR